MQSFIIVDKVGSKDIRAANRIKQRQVILGIFSQNDDLMGHSISLGSIGMTFYFLLPRNKKIDLHKKPD